MAVKLEILLFGTFLEALRLLNQKTNKMGLLGTLIVGALAGWLGSTLYKGSGLGILGNIIVGIVGAAFGYWFLGLLNVYLGSGFWGYLFTGAIGAAIILLIVNLIFGRVAR